MKFGLSNHTMQFGILWEVWDQVSNISSVVIGEAEIDTRQSPQGTPILLADQTPFQSHDKHNLSQTTDTPLYTVANACTPPQ